MGERERDVPSNEARSFVLCSGFRVHWLRIWTRLSKEDMCAGSRLQGWVEGRRCVWERKHRDVVLELLRGGETVGQPTGVPRS